MTKKRRKIDAALRAKMALELLRERPRVHPNQFWPSPVVRRRGRRPRSPAGDRLESLRDVLAAAGADEEAAIFAVMEHPGPPGSLPTRTLASSDCRMLPPSRRAQIKLVCCAKADLLYAAAEQAGADQARLLRKGGPAVGEDVDQAPSLILSPSRSDISRTSRSNEIAWLKRK